jgi:hypothetical protein
MKKAMKFIGGMFAVLVAIIVIALIVDISNDVNYEVVEEGPGSANTNTLSIRVTTEESDKDSLESILDNVEEDYESTDVDAIWLNIHDTSDKPFGKLLATGKIPYNFDGEVLVGEKEPVLEIK